MLFERDQQSVLKSGLSDLNERSLVIGCMGQLKSGGGHHDEVANTVIVSAVSGLCCSQFRMCDADLEPLTGHSRSSVDLFFGRVATHSGNLGACLGLRASGSCHALSGSWWRDLTTAGMDSAHFVCWRAKRQSVVFCVRAVFGSAQDTAVDRGQNHWLTGGELGSKRRFLGWFALTHAAAPTTRA